MSAFPLVSPNHQTTCYSCGVLFASPVLAERMNDGKTFYCPNGHGQHYTETEATRLRAEVERTKKQLETVSRDRDWQRSQRQTAEKSIIAHKGLVTKARNKLARVHQGVCPDCNRSFQNLAAHMKTKHLASGGK